MSQEDQIKTIIQNLEGIPYRTWEVIKKIVDMRFEAIQSKNAFEATESVFESINDLL